MPIERRAGLSGRHIVTCGTPATRRRDSMVSGNGTLLFSTMGEIDGQKRIPSGKEFPLTALPKAIWIIS
jgi:hypothetical protein